MLRSTALASSLERLLPVKEEPVVVVAEGEREEGETAERAGYELAGHVGT
jgi:hypothetical protein